MDELFTTAWAQELDNLLANKPFQQQQLQQQLPDNIKEKKYKKEKLELQEQNLELSGRSAFSQQFQHNNLDSNKALATQLWQNELGMNLAELAAWNIQLYKHHSDNITLELVENQLENKKKKHKKKTSTASQQLSHQQLRQQQLQLPQLCRQQPDTAISRQLPKELLSATSSQTAAWPAATLTINFSFSKKELSEQHLHNKSFYNNQLVNQELVHNKLQRTDAF